MSLFRSAIRDGIDARLALHTPTMPQRSIRLATPLIPKWRWALVAAAIVVLVTVPFLTNKRQTQTVIETVPTATDPDALMRAVNLHLSRTVPAPMEPMMALLPGDGSQAEPGGVQ
jgi:hypothetical protein